MMNKKSLNILLNELDSIKKRAIYIGEKGGDFKSFIKFYTKNKVGMKFNKDGHSIEVVAAYICARVGANVISSAKLDRLGADLIVNGLPIQIKYNWLEGLFDWQYKEKYIWVYGEKEYINVVYPQKKDNATEALSKLLLSDGIKLSTKEKEDIKEVWKWATSS